MAPESVAPGSKAPGSVVLGIDTSCDETAAAVVAGRRQVLSSVVASQIPLHRRFGGVVPEIACRAHTENVTRVIEEAMDRAGDEAGPLTGVAVTHRPGLIGALLVGVGAAKGVALARGLPFVGVNHLEAHVWAAALDRDDFPLPAVALVVSGGHTSLFLVKGVGEMEVLGRTVDDAAGEAFDKAAAILGLGYPGGPEVERAARDGDDRAVPFKRPYLAPDSLDFSFSGIKTAVLYHACGQNRRRQGSGLLPGVNVADVAASFQAAVVAVLVRKTLTAVAQTGARHVVLGGGVAANGPLRETLWEACDREGVGVTIPEVRFCTDNAAMVASLGARRLMRGEGDALSLDAYSRMTGTR